MSVKARILDAGVGLLHTQGIAALTQPRIAKAAGVSQSHLTYYFPTRNQLLIAIAESSIEGLLGQLRLPAGGAGDELALAERLATLIRHQPQVRMLLGLIVAADEEPGLREALRGFVPRMRKRVAALLRHNGKATTPQQTLLFHAAVVGLAVMNLARQTDESAADIHAGLAELLRLLATDAGEHQPWPEASTRAVTSARRS